MTLQENSPKKRPFLAFPDTEAYYPAATIAQARSMVFRSLDRGEGVSLVFGECGVGKTLLSRLLADEFELDAPVLRLTGFPFSDRKSFLAQILFELRSDSAGNEQDVRLRILDYFRRTDYRRFFLLIDDAERLPLFALDELCSFLDLTAGRSAQVRIALFGSHRFEERLNHPKLARFCQRIVCRAWLEPFTRRETCDYIDRRTESCDAPRFSPEAKTRIHQLTDGVPRLINQIADLALWFGPVRGQIDLATIEKSWETLQQIPCAEQKSPAASSSVASSSVASSSAVSGAVADTSPTIEFGSLDDEESTPPCDAAAKTVIAETEHSEIQRDTTAADNTAFNNTAVDTTAADEVQSDFTAHVPVADEPAETVSFSVCLPDEEVIEQIKKPAICDEALASFDEEEETEEIEPQQLDQIDTDLDRRLRERLLGESLHAPRRDKLKESPAAFDISTPFEKSEKSELYDTSVPFETPESFDTAAPSTRSDHRAGYLEELRLLELEVSQEAALIRKIREMHTGMESFRIPDDSAGPSVSFEKKRRTESILFDESAADRTHEEPLDDERIDPDAAHTTRPPFGKAPYRPEKPNRSFTSTFERLYADEKRKKDTPPDRKGGGL